MKVSLIIAVYKDYQALDLILQQMLLQDYDNFEVVIAEDATSQEVPLIIEEYPTLQIKHCFHEDSGIRKMRSQNNGIKAATGDYLIFIDGDCIPYPDFLSNHVALAKPNNISSGRRVNLGPKYSGLIRDKEIQADTIANNFLLFFIPLLIDGKEGHIESGFSFKPTSWFYSRFLVNTKRSTGILGCNFACFKRDIININGFDESYLETAIGDDTDIEWRFLANGLNIQSVKNSANLFHLYHKRTYRDLPYYDDMIKLMNERKFNAQYWANQGINKLP